MTQRREIALGILLLLLSLAVGWYLIDWFFEVFLKADKSVQTSIIAGTIAVFGILFTYWKERTRSLREAHRDKKIEVYSVFFEMVFNLMQQSKDENYNPETDQVFKDQWMKLTKECIFYGSPKVLKTIAEFKADSVSPEPNSIGVVRKVGNIFLAMREDIGLSNRGLNNLTIHQVYINEDVQELENTLKVEK
ncbi:hypothetical protein [Ahrensia sp. 13_GOM-1096m]|uniref:hypothetical protein n=1 Tax=Ahrensia sp. 13_GOM-1096m TaxID=1380380 RepID=UPI00047B5360|nr:hypothetical protein [Ahrensia sp. 13_GOM-1096m]